MLHTKFARFLMVVLSHYASICWTQRPIRGKVSEPAIPDQFVKDMINNLKTDIKNDPKMNEIIMPEDDLNPLLYCFQEVPTFGYHVKMKVPGDYEHFVFIEKGERTILESHEPRKMEQDPFSCSERSENLFPVLPDDELKSIITKPTDENEGLDTGPHQTLEAYFKEKEATPVLYCPVVFKYFGTYWIKVQIREDVQVHVKIDYTKSKPSFVGIDKNERLENDSIYPF